ncbi:glycosyltransferase [Arthrobacter alpinus]|uniref:glycosyltransferase n=1 Tax=Arthrobacter alpinus TaxID=656366 RepID=UPI001646427C|nr:glycosyltransferase [Arthrobacter alpinus]
MKNSLTVLQAFPVPRPTTNPYLVMLGDSLRKIDEVSVLNFTWRQAIFGKYDVYHSHWPEILVGGSGQFKTLIKQLLVVIFLIRLKLTRTPIVRTLHNINRPDGMSWRQTYLLDAIDRHTSLFIRLNPTTPVMPKMPSVTIPHGHYKQWFSSYPSRETITGRFSFVGLIRRYKGVEQLLESFAKIDKSNTDISLQIAGNPSTEEIAKVVRELGLRDERVSTELRFLTDAKMVKIVTCSELVVLPYHFMHNSGSLLMALSLARPVLVPDNAVNRGIEKEVGPGWVHFFSGELDSEDLLAALAESRGQERGREPDLDRRNWDTAGVQHVQAYRAAISRVRRGRE